MIKRYFLFLLGFFLVSFLTLWINPLIYDDAAMYALAVKNMVLHHHWLVPLMTPGDLASFLDKPPLGLWLLGLFPAVLGINEFTIHLPNFFYYLIYLAVIYWGVSKFSSKKIATYAVLMAATSLVLIIYSRSPKLDLLLALWVTLAHFDLFDYLKNKKTAAFYRTALWMALGFLIKTGFAIIIPGLTFLALFGLTPEIRARFFKFEFLKVKLIALLIFGGIVGGVFFLQRLVLGDLWGSYLSSILIQSKYNTSYLKLGFHLKHLIFILVTVFPWTPLALSAIRPRFKLGRLSFQQMNQLWVWGILFFLLFFFRQTDFRTFTLLVTPLSVLGAFKIQALFSKHRFAKRRWEKVWGIVLSVLLLLIPIVMLLDPKDPNGVMTVLTLIFFAFAQVAVTVFAWRASRTTFSGAVLLTFVAYGFLFFSSQSIAQTGHPFLHWDLQIKKYQTQGYPFYIYRPQDRPMRLSSDLAWVDFMAGPAKQYFWEKEKITKILNQPEYILLTDPHSFNDLKIPQQFILAHNREAVLVVRSKNSLQE